MDGAQEPHAGWTFLTDHARVLAVIAADNTTRVRDIAVRCRLTERAVQKIITDSEQCRRSSRTWKRAATSPMSGRPLQRLPHRLGTFLRHPADAPATVADLLTLVDRHDSARLAETAADKREG
ncbi:ArsR family transcriptional regulator [Streptomyces sp. NPDC001068]|uniref:ArsR family transcriptional regulator n=1 Tax=Streptomyces sp. NPDC001068 TaxID=3364544 RepID=UPI0036D0C314